MRMNKFILTLIVILSGFGSAYSQYSPTGSKVQYKNGIALGSKDSTTFGANDSLTLTIDRNNKLMWRGNGASATWRVAGSSADLLAYKLIADTFFTTGYTTRARTKQVIDSLGAVKYGGTVTTNTIPLASGVNTFTISAIVQTASGGRILLNGAVDNGSDGLRLPGAIATTSTTASTSSSTGSIRTAGGIGVAGAANIDGTVRVGASGENNINAASGGLTWIGSNRLRYNSTTGLFSRSNVTERASMIILDTSATIRFITQPSTSQSGSYALSAVQTIWSNGNISVGNTTDNGFKFDVTGSARFSAGATTARLTASSLVTNKDSIPISLTHRFMLTVDTTGTPGTNRVNRRDISNFYVGEATFDTTTRILSIPKAVGSPTNVVIPRGTASGSSGITALSSNRLGNLVSVIGDNGSTTTFSIRDADSASTMRFSDTAAMLTNYLRESDTATMLVPYYRTADATTALGLKLNISDTATMLLPFVQYSDTANIVAGYVRNNIFTDSLTAVQARIQTKQPLGAYITLADSSTILAGRWLPNRSADSIAVIRALANTKTSNTGTVTSIATNSGTGISGGTITTTGTLAIDTVLLSTRAWRQKGVDSVNGLINARVRYTDTASMLLPFVQYSDTANQMSGYLRKNFALLLQDTASAYNGYLRKNFALLLQDTLSAFSNYLRKSDTLSMLANRLKISDTSTMLSPYARTSGLGSYLLKADSLSGGYTTWALTKKKVDSLGAVITAANSLKKDISDTLFNNGYTTRIRTKTGLDSLAAVFNAANALKKNVADTFFTTGYTTRARTKQYGDSIAAVKLNISDTLTMLANRLRISDTASMLSNYRRSSTLILNSNLANSTISGISLGNNLNNISAGNGLVGTAYNGSSAQSWRVDTSVISTKANVTGALVAKLNIYDTATMLANYARKSGTAFTGGVSGTSLLMSGSVTANTLIVNSNTTNVGTINTSNATGGFINWQTNGTTIADLGTATQVFGSGGSEVFAINGRGARAIALGTNGVNRLNIASTGEVSLSSSISSTRGVFNNSTQSQLEIFGWNNIQGASTNAGEIRFGGTTSIQGRLIYSSAGNSTLYLDNTFDNANAEIKLRTRVAGTAVDALTLTSTAATFPSTMKSAGLIQPISLKTANYTLTTNDHTVIFNTASGNLTATLPAGVEGQIFVLRKSAYGISTNDLTITPNGSETIEGATSYTISACSGVAVTLQFLSGNWYIINMAFIGNPC